MMAWRHYLVICLFFAGCLALAGRVLHLTLLEKEFLQDQGDARSVREEIIPSHRGLIYDRLGEPLAVSTPTVSVWSDPSRATLAKADIERLAPLLQTTPKALAERLDAKRGKAFVYLKRRVSWRLAERIRALEVGGLHFRSEYRRYYPAAETAAHVVGITNMDDVGLEGVELAFDERLRGRQGRKIVLKDRLGAVIRDLDYVAAPVFGQDLSLSIDMRLQYFAYRELKDAVLGHGAASGSIVILDARSGEILALANSPSYNPNASLTAALAGMRNRAVTDTYEPGSTVKPFAALAALESGQYEAGTRIDTAPGYFSIRGKLIEDPNNYGELTLAGVVRKSSQVGISKVALALPERAIYNTLHRAGADTFIGSGLPGESMAKMDDAQLKSRIVRATLAYGYGLSVSPLQLAQAYLTLANGGVRLPPSIVKRSRPPAGERVFDAKLTDQVLAMMEGVVSPSGTAPGARVPGYRVAGKTGTTRIVGSEGYTDKRHLALFAGVVPATDPKIVMVVVVNEPKGAEVGGGAVAGPVFSRVTERAMRLLGVSPDQGRLLAAGSALS